MNPSTGRRRSPRSSLGFGSHSVIAEFLANTPFQNSISSALTQYVTSAGTSPTLTLVPVRNRVGKVTRFDLSVAGAGHVRRGPAPRRDRDVLPQWPGQSTWSCRSRAAPPSLVVASADGQQVRLREVQRQRRSYLGSATQNFYVSYGRSSIARQTSGWVPKSER